MKIHNAQSSTSNLQAFHDCLAFWLVTPFLSNFLKALAKGTVTDGFPSVTSVLQNILFSRCLSTMYFLLLPALHLGVMRKSFLFFREAPLITVQASAEHIPFIFCFVRSILLLSHTVPLFARNVPMVSNFLKENSSLSTALFSSISTDCLFKKALLFLLVIPWNSAFRWVYLFISHSPIANYFELPLTNDCFSCVSAKSSTQQHILPTLSS